MSNKISHLMQFSNNRKSNSELDTFTVSNLRFDAPENAVVGRAHMITQQDIDESNQDGRAILECEFDVRFIFDVEDGQLYIDGITVDEECQLELVGQCADLTLDDSTDWDEEITNLAVFDAALMLMTEPEKDAICAFAHDAIAQ